MTATDLFLDHVAEVIIENTEIPELILNDLSVFLRDDHAVVFVDLKGLHLFVGEHFHKVAVNNAVGSVDASEHQPERQDYTDGQDGIEYCQLVILLHVVLPTASGGILSVLKVSYCILPASEPPQTGAHGIFRRNQDRSPPRTRSG